MSVLSAETVQVSSPFLRYQTIAESAGLSLKDDAASVLVQDLEYRLREIIHEASKFMLHAKRTKLRSEDVNRALKVRQCEPLYGFAALKSVAWKSTSVASQRLFYLEEKELDLDDVIYAPLPPVPLDVTYTAHWLAIDGVQPVIPQNPTPAEIKAIEAGLIKAGASVADVFPNSQNSKSLESISTVKGILSKELQLYFEKVTSGIFSDGSSAVIVESLESDPGLQPLLPYFLQFINENVTKNIKNLRRMWAVMRMTRAILLNPNLFVEPYLHQLMPCILTCIVAKKLSMHKDEDHWALRDFTALLTAHICENYKSYPTLQPRITKTLLRAFLDPLKSYATNYGAIVGLSALGPEVIKVLIVPNVKIYGEQIRKDLVDGTPTDAQRCFDAIIHERKVDTGFKLNSPAFLEQLGLFADPLMKRLGNLE